MLQMPIIRQGLPKDVAEENILHTHHQTLSISISSEFASTLSDKLFAARRPGRTKERELVDALSYALGSNSFSARSTNKLFKRMIRSGIDPGSRATHLS